MELEENDEGQEEGKSIAGATAEADKQLKRPRDDETALGHEVDADAKKQRRGTGRATRKKETLRSSVNSAVETMVCSFSAVCLP